MSRWLTSYADAAFQSARDRLMDSAARHGIDVLRPWGREDLERTGFYQVQRGVLDRPRGGGYWLWKPFVMLETLKEMRDGDLLVYSDAGIEIIADLDPLFDLCRERSEILLFANPYDDPGDAPPISCGAWTKRDCFVFMDCDDPACHASPLLDASVLVVRKSPRAVAFVREWWLYCCQPQLMTDAPNVCGLPDLPGYVAHRWDQSILSLLAWREGLELFRQPSQHANHLKSAPYREPGEPIRVPYGAKGIASNSPYPTLLNHHRGLLGQRDLHIQVRRVLAAPRARVFEAWIDPEVIRAWTPLDLVHVIASEAELRVGGAYRHRLGGKLMSPGFELRGTYLEIEPPARLVHTWPWHTRVTVEFHHAEGGTAIEVSHGPFPTEQVRAYHRLAWDAFVDRVAAAVGCASLAG